MINYEDEPMYMPRGENDELVMVSKSQRERVALFKEKMGPRLERLREEEQTYELEHPEYRAMKARKNKMAALVRNALSDGKPREEIRRQLLQLKK